jgi:drug/metabolite transporter (DMT)-like permease
MSNNNKLISWLILIALALIWGSSFILIKRGLVVFSPGEVGAIRVISAGLFLSPFALRKIGSLNRGFFGKLFSVGMVGSFIPAFLFAKAQTEIDSSIAGVLNALTPFFVLLIGVIVYKQPITKNVVIGILIGLCGTAGLILVGSDGAIDALNFYALFVVIATLCYGINVNLIKFRISALSSMTITSVAMLLTMPFAIVYLFVATDFTTKLATHEMALQSLGYLSLLGVMGTAIALVLFNHLIKITSPVFSSSVTYLIPIVAVIWGLVDGEVLLFGHYLGMAAIVVGVYLVNKKNKK